MLPSSKKRQAHVVRDYFGRLVLQSLSFRPLSQSLSPALFMSLSAACRAQHAKENAITRKWLLVGFAITVSAPLGLLPLLRFVLPGTSEPSARISISVVGPADLQGEIIEAASPPEKVFDFINEAEPAAPDQPPDSASLESGSAAAPLPAIQSTPLLPQTSDISDEPTGETSTPSVAEVRETSEATDDTTPERENASGQLIEEGTITTELNPAGATDTAESTAARTTASRSIQSSTQVQIQDRSAPTAAGAQTSGSNTAASGSSATNQPISSTESGADRPGASALGPSIARRRQDPISCRYCDPTALLGETASSGARVEPSVSLEYDGNGNVVGARIERSSGDANVDRAAVDAALTFAFNNPSGESGTISVDFEINGGGGQLQPSTQETSPVASPVTPSNQPAPSDSSPSDRADSSELSTEPDLEPTTEPASTQPLGTQSTPASTDETAGETAGAADLADIPSLNLETAPRSLEIAPEITPPATETEATPAPAVADPSLAGSEPSGAEALLTEPDF